jgi:hypothetical protein
MEASNFESRTCDTRTGLSAPRTVVEECRLREMRYEGSTTVPRQSDEIKTQKQELTPPNFTASAQDATVLMAKSKQHSRRNDLQRHCPHTRGLTAHVISPRREGIATALPLSWPALPAKVDRVARALLAIPRQEVCNPSIRSPGTTVFLQNDTPLSPQTFTETSHHSIVFRTKQTVHHPPKSIIMSTCARTCQSDICSGEDSDLEARLTMIFGVLDSITGLLGTLVAILVGYLQFRQMREFTRRQPTIDEL